MGNKLVVSVSPHSNHKDSTQSIMRDVIIALLPALCVAVWIFGWRALMVTGISVAACVAFEWLFEKIAKTPNTIGDLSAVVTGVLIAFNVPVTISPFMLIIGDFVAIFIVKQMFGGIGDNIVNPAIVARIVLMLSFTTAMTTWVLPFKTADMITGATPLASYMEVQGGAAAQLPSYLDLFIGRIGGSMGEISAAALLLGGIYLCIRKIINPIIPMLFVGTVFLGTWALGFDPVYQILSGGLMLGAIFMATDYTTTPITLLGKAIFAISCGLITVIIRVYGSYPEGVSYAIVLMNILAPLIDRATLKKPFGQIKEAKAK